MNAREAVAQYDLGRELAARGKLGDAAALFERAIRLQADFIEAYNRDLLFPVQDSRHTLPEIAAFLASEHNEEGDRMIVISPERGRARAHWGMLTLDCAVLGAILVPVGAPPRAQDIVGIEDCTKTSGLDKRTGCLQSNVNFLQQLVMRNAAESRQRLNAAVAEIAGLKAEIAALKGLVASQQASLSELKAAQRAEPAKGEKKPQAK